MDPKLEKRLKPFIAHGVDSLEETGDQVRGTCPFTNKENKFYINPENLLWDSKTAGLSGNLSQFLAYRATAYAETLAARPALLQELADHRQLPKRAFAPWNIGWTGRAYSIPVCDARGHTVDIRTYRLGDAVKSTSGVKVGLLGAERIPGNPRDTIYVCEGEWDAIGLDYLRRVVDAAGAVVGVPGAGTFKSDWAKWFTGRHVVLLYDKDGPGEEGERKAADVLKAHAQSIQFVHWPAAMPDGFDTRDWVVAGLREKKPKKAWVGLQAMLRPTPKQPTEEDKPLSHINGSSGPEGGPSSGGMLPPSAWTKKVPTLDDVRTVFKRWLFLESTDAISVMLATVVSQQIDGEPIWMFLVGPPGSAKTETLNSLSLVPSAYMTSTLTPHSLISGANWKDGGDPSLIPRLDGKVMVIKDFTSILSLRDTEKDEIFGILRDAFDGKCGKEFGNGVVRKYESRFTILAAVTPSIYSLSSQHTALGERFLKFGVGDNLVHAHEEDIIQRAIQNINVETTMRAEMADVVLAFLERRIGMAHISSGSLPTISPQIQSSVIHLARFGARMRGIVTRDTYRNDIVTSRPSAEVGSRLGKQLAKLCQSLALVHGRRTVTDDEYRLVKKVMLDTIPQRTEDILRQMLKHCPTEKETMTLQEMSVASKYPTATVSRILQDLNVLEIVTRSQLKKGKFQWTVSSYIRDLIQRAHLYETREEVNRPRPFTMRVIRRRKRRGNSTGGSSSLSLSSRSGSSSSVH